MNDKAATAGPHRAAAALLEEQLKSQHPGMDEALRRSLAKLGASIAVRDAQEARAQPAKAVRLPVWPEAMRGVPNSLLRGALFAAIRGMEVPTHSFPGTAPCQKSRQSWHPP